MSAPLTADDIKDIVRRAVLDRTACVAGWEGFSPGSIERMAGDIANRVAEAVMRRMASPTGGDR